jgi:hypothetical protein
MEVYVEVTRDGGRSWESLPWHVDLTERERAEGFPFSQVVPFEDGALAIVGDPCGDNSSDTRLELYRLRGNHKRLIHETEHPITYVSVDAEGRVLIEEDLEPHSWFDASGRRWLELVPPIVGEGSRRGTIGTSR